MTNGFVVPSGVETMDVAGAECPECGGELSLHQPDESLAERLLATCPGCKAWFVTDPAVRHLVGVPGTGCIDGRGEHH